MKKKAFIAVSVLIALFLAGVGIAPRAARAQVPMFFGATRFSVIQTDNNNNLYIAMSVATAPGSSHRPHSQIFFTQSRDGGKSFDNLPFTRNLTNSPGEAFGPSMAVWSKDKLQVYITYQDSSPGPTQAFILTTKKKTKFRKPEILSPNAAGGFSPRVALDSGGNVNIVYGDTTDLVRRVRFLRSTDEGLTFSDSVRVSGDSEGAFEPEIAVTPGDAINVAWEDTVTGTSTIRFARSTDHGATFSDPVQVSTGDGAANEAYLAADASGRLSVVWAQVVGSEKHAFYSRSTDNGQTFSAPLQLSHIKGASISKPLALPTNDTVYVAFQDEQTGDLQVYLTTSDDAGVTFARTAQVSHADNSCGRGHSPGMAVDTTGTLHIIWIDSSHINPCADEGLLFYSRSTNGRTFTPEQLILAGIETPSP
jgi:hypothetical protein